MGLAVSDHSLGYLILIQSLGVFRLSVLEVLKSFNKDKPLEDAELRQRDVMCIL